MIFFKKKKNIVTLMVWAALLLFIIMAISPTLSCSALGLRETLATNSSQNDLSMEEKLVVGSDTSYPPFGYINEQGNTDGFDMEVIMEIADRLEKEIEVKSMPFDSLYRELNEGNIDLIISALTVNEDRKAQVDYTIPYYTMRYLMLTLSDAELRLREDMEGKVVGILHIDKGCLPEQILSRYKVVEYNDIRVMIESLRSGEIEGLIITKPIAINILDREGRMFRVVDTFHSEREFVIALRKNSGIKEEVNDIIETMGRDGTMEEIYKHWFPLD